MELTHILHTPQTVKRNVQVEYDYFCYGLKYSNSGAVERIGVLPVYYNELINHAGGGVFVVIEDDYYYSKKVRVNKGETAKITLPSEGAIVFWGNSINGDPFKLKNVNTDRGRVDDVYAIHNDIISLFDTETGGVKTFTPASNGDLIVLTKNRDVLLSLQFEITSTRPTTLIKEPVGFDALKTEIKRHEYHGVGAELSMGELEFYGVAFDAIKAAYERNIDTQLIYEVLDEQDDTLYKGFIDLTTCAFFEGDYQSVKAKVGEVGDMTTFNNRTEVEIDLNEPKTVDGLDVEKPDWINLHIPLKHLIYTNISQRLMKETIKQAGGEDQDNAYIKFKTRYTSVHSCIFLPFGSDTSSGFGSFNLAEPYVTTNIADVEPQYVCAEDHVTEFGEDTETQIDARFHSVVRIVSSGHTYQDKTIYNFYMRLVACAEISTEDQNHPIIFQYLEGERFHVRSIDSVDGGVTVDLRLNGTLPAKSTIKFYIRIETDDEDSWGWMGDYWIQCWFDILKESYVKMTMYDTLLERYKVNAEMLLVHDALNIVAHAISENHLAVRSDWYQTKESHWEAGDTIGDGAMKALTNGYHIRGLASEPDKTRNMPLSFKSLIQSLDALDCIGWGFSREDDSIVVRVERWDWFYKEDVVFERDNVAEVTTEIYQERIPTELTIGYKKYATEEQYKSIDSPHGSLSFVNGIKAVSKSIKKECEFIADNYAIEETRRAKTKKNPAEEFTYDENVFVFELLRTNFVRTGKITYEIPHSAADATGIGREDEFINAKLTPRHMAARWRDYIFATNNTTPFRFTSGKLNYNASFQTYPEDRHLPIIYGVARKYLKSYAISAPQSENDNITHTPAMFKAEKISFTCPVRLSEYRDIIANPYGMVIVNGKSGWILSFKYSFKDGLGDFDLIAYNEDY